MGKRSGPAERLLQFLDERWAPGAGKLGVAEESRDVRRRESSSTCKRSTKTQQTHECKPAHHEQGAGLCQGRSLLLSPALPGSCPMGGGTLQGSPPLGPHESTASHAVRNWVGSSGWRGKA